MSADIDLSRIGGNGRKRPFTAGELALFTEYREHRADHRPRECCGGHDCWVEFGPPAFGKERGDGSGHSHCLGCGGYPR